MEVPSRFRLNDKKMNEKKDGGRQEERKEGKKEEKGDKNIDKK